MLVPLDLAEFLGTLCKKNEKSAGQSELENVWHRQVSSGVGFGSGQSSLVWGSMSLLLLARRCAALADAGRGPCEISIGCSKSTWRQVSSVAPGLWGTGRWGNGGRLGFTCNLRRPMYAESCAPFVALPFWRPGDAHVTVMNHGSYSFSRGCIFRAFNALR